MARTAPVPGSRTHGVGISQHSRLRRSLSHGESNLDISFVYFNEQQIHRNDHNSILSTSSNAKYRFDHASALYCLNIRLTIGRA